jgi:hypothetical protein
MRSPCQAMSPAGRRPRGAWARGIALSAIAAAIGACVSVAAWPQTPTATPAAPMSMAPARPPAIAATEVLRAADSVARALATQGRIPDRVTVTRTDGNGLSLSAAQVFVLLARFLGTGYEEGLTPESTPAPPQMSGPLERSEAPAGAGREIVLASSDLLAQTRPTADVAESTGHLPAAIWVAGLRLTPAQFLGGMATLLQYALYMGRAPDQVTIGQYPPPVDWGDISGLGREPPAASTGTSGAEAATPGALPPIDYAPGAVEPGSPYPYPAETPPPKPELTLYVPAKPKWSGEQTLTVEYQGPPAFIRLTIDGLAKAVSNMWHFTYVWDTRLEPDGRHTIEAAAVNSAGDTLERAKAIVETANGNVPLR